MTSGEETGRSDERRRLDRRDTVRSLFECFSRKDFDGALALFDPDVQLVDLLVPDVVLRGREAVRRHWEHRYDQVAMMTTIGENIVNTDDKVIVVARCQIYDKSEGEVVPPFFVSFRFSFREDSIVRCEGRITNSVPPKVKDLLHLDGEDSEI